MITVTLDGLLQKAQQAVLAHSLPISADDVQVKGYSYEDQNLSIQGLLDSYKTSGYQASNLGRAATILAQMLRWRLAHEDLTDSDKEDEETENDENSSTTQPQEFSWANPHVRVRTRARIFLSFTSNLISSGLREAFVYLAKHRLVDCIVTTAGGIEEDFVKCLGTFVLGDFHKFKGAELRTRGWNRIGNIYVPNENYVKFESWFFPILDEALEEQKTNNKIWTPSTLIRKMGLAINDESSLYYWCAKNDIPVFCPAFTDGSIGDMIFFHRSKSPGLIIDVAADIAAMNTTAISSKKSGIIILGGGSAKHHVCNANLMRNGADFAVYINTAQEFDGCDSGASPDEAVSWGKIRANAKYCKVSCDATIAFPILVSTVCKDEVEYRKTERKELESRPPVAHPNIIGGYILTSPWRADIYAS